MSCRSTRWASSASQIRIVRPAKVIGAQSEPRSNWEVAAQDIYIVAPRRRAAPSRVSPRPKPSVASELLPKRKNAQPICIPPVRVSLPKKIRTPKPPKIDADPVERLQASLAQAVRLTLKDSGSYFVRAVMEGGSLKLSENPLQLIVCLTIEGRDLTIDDFADCLKLQIALRNSGSKPSVALVCTDGRYLALPSLEPKPCRRALAALERSKVAPWRIAHYMSTKFKTKVCTRAQVLRLTLRAPEQSNGRLRGDVNQIEGGIPVRQSPSSLTTPVLVLPVSIDPVAKAREDLERAVSEVRERRRPGKPMDSFLRSACAASFEQEGKRAVVSVPYRKRDPKTAACLTSLHRIQAMLERSGSTLAVVLKTLDGSFVS